MPRRRTERVACPPQLALALALLVAISTRPASAEPHEPVRVPAAAPSAKSKHVTGARVLLAAADKQRVPKPPRDEPRYKPDSSGTSSGSSSSDDDDWTTQCVVDCLGNVITSICDGLTSSRSASKANTGRTSAAPWSVGDQGRLTANLAADSVALWDSPGVGGAQAPTRAWLAHGQRVVVLETAVLPDGMWIRVRPEDRLEPVGWVRDGSAIRAAPIPTASPAPVRHRRPTGGGVRIVAGGSGFGPSELNVEYLNGGLRVSVERLSRGPNNWQWGSGAGFRLANGHPQVLYLTSATVEEPLDSRLWMLDLGVRGGQRFRLGSGFRFDWLLGPVLTYVHEWCDLEISDATTGALIVRRDETLGRWAGGGELRLGFARALSGGSEISIVAAGWLLAWQGHGERSLSTDFVHGSIHGFDVALGFTFPVR